VAAALKISESSSVAPWLISSLIPLRRIASEVTPDELLKDDNKSEFDIQHSLLGMGYSVLKIGMQWTHGSGRIIGQRCPMFQAKLKQAHLGEGPAR